MTFKMKLKLSIDLLMSLFLLLLLSYQLVSQQTHELIGVGMVVLFLAHNLLNLSWYRNLFRGRWTPVRVLTTTVNLALLLLLLAEGASGVVMSRSLFTALPIRGGMALSRTVHLAGAYWGLVLMSFHLGMHWRMVTGLIRKKFPTLPVLLLRLAAVAIAGYGLVRFIQADIFSYMVLRNEFAFFDYEKNAALVLLEQFAMMGLWVFIGHYAAKGLNKLTTQKKHA